MEGRKSRAPSLPDAQGSVDRACNIPATHRGCGPCLHHRAGADKCLPSRISGTILAERHRLAHHLDLFTHRGHFAAEEFRNLFSRKGCIFRSASAKWKLIDRDWMNNGCIEVKDARE